MDFFENTSFDGHEQVTFFHHKRTGLRAIVAIHNTNLGPALGGCRMWSYENDQDAVTDVLRLSKGMTYKAALAGLKLGGGKSVIIGNSRSEKTPELFQAMGRCIDRMMGRYIIAEDVGTSVSDMVEISKMTNHVVGLPAGQDQNAASGDPSPVTAYGTFLGIKASVEYQLGKKDIKGMHVIVQGLGHVGMALCKYLHEAGVKLTVTDINDEAIEKAKADFGADFVEPDKIYDVEADVFAPCALGAIINDDTVNRLKVKVVAGSANNQLLEDKHGENLRQKGILYAPDFIINAGGLINVYYEMLNTKGGDKVYTRDDVFKHLEVIPENLIKTYEIADLDNLSIGMAADRLAENIFEAPMREKYGDQEKPLIKNKGKSDEAA
tara:strand:- start:2250 stop:3389 length:1140 start_codon:yes stop_codon:yes gene_type:complete